MALNRIYIHRKDLSYSEVKESDSDITFIRKDALVELLREKRKAVTECFAINERKVAALSVIDFLVNKIEQL